MSDSNVLLLRLPKALIEQILSKWLDIHDVGVLDTAMTNKEHRLEFLQCLKEMRNPTVPVSFDGKSEKDETKLSWISKRQIHVETITLISFENKKKFIESLHLPSLRKLIVGYFYESPQWLRHIPQLCPLLVELSVGRFDTKAIVEDLIFVLNQCLQLKNVSIGLIYARTCTDDVWAGLQEFGHRLVDIHIAYGKLDEGFKNFIKYCPRLRNLSYSGFDDNGELLKCVAQSCPLLEEIDFDTCSKPALEELSRNCKQLRKIEMCHYSYNDKVTIKVSAADLEVLKQIDTLEELILSSSDLTVEKLAVISGFRHLKRLKLEEYGGVDELAVAGFRVFEGSPISKTLQSISVLFHEGGDYFLPVQGFDIGGMMAGIASCHNLRNADLSYHCDDAGLVVLGAGCPLLEEISLTYGPVTVDGLVELAEQCQHLTKVVLDYDSHEGRDTDLEIFFDGSRHGPGHARAVADIPIVRSRLPHILFKCSCGLDEDWDEWDDNDDDEDDDDDLEAEGFTNSYFDGSEYGSGHARAVAAMPIARSPLPHMQLECFEGFDHFHEYDDDDDDDDDDDFDDNDDDEDDDDDDKI